MGIFKKKKEKNSTPTINVPLFASLVTMMNQTSNSFITKLESFIYKDMQVSETVSESNYHQLHLH